ncbi:hypothetical protein ACLB1Q_20950 [Escherichia coli]
MSQLKRYFSGRRDYRPHDDPDGQRSGALSGGRHYRHRQKRIRAGPTAWVFPRFTAARSAGWTPR